MTAQKDELEISLVYTVRSFWRALPKRGKGGSLQGEPRYPQCCLVTQPCPPLTIRNSNINLAPRPYTSTWDPELNPPHLN